MPSSSPPVILQVLPSLVTGGVERGTIEMTQAVAEWGGVALVASAGGRMERQVQQAGGRHIILPLDTRNPLAIRANATRLMELIRTERVAIVHARSRAPAWSAWLACQRTGAHFVTTYHGAYGEDLPFKRKWNSVMARGEIVIAASRYIATLIQQQHGTDPARIRVIPRGVDPVAFNPTAVSPERVAMLRREWQVPDGHLVAVMPGRLTSWKGQGILLQALARLDNSQICCVFVGSDQGRRHYTTSLLRDAQELDIAASVRFPGGCDDMPAAFMLADVVVHASTRAEAFGRVVIEAQAMQRPVIASDLGGPAETVTHAETGWLVPPAQPAALAAAIERVLSLSEQERQALGQRAREAVLRHNTVRAMQQATLQVYQELLAA
jgi:glycosyltransferase involved in cell wall biosynthesis